LKPCRDAMMPVHGGGGDVTHCETLFSWEILLLAVFVLLAMEALGSFRSFRLQAVVADIFIVIPANVALTVAFVVLTPVRWLYYKLLNKFMTAFISLFTIRPGFWAANWDLLLDAFPIGYAAILGGSDILKMSEAECRQRLGERVQQSPFPTIRSCCNKLLPPRVVNSLLLRLGFACTVTPVLAWWLIGFTYIPLLTSQVLWETTPPEVAPEDMVEKSPLPEEDGLGGSPKAVKQSGVLSVPKQSKAPSVYMQIPKCTFLVKAREKYGEQGGNTACVNE